MKEYPDEMRGPKTCMAKICSRLGETRERSYSNAAVEGGGQNLCKSVP